MSEPQSRASAYGETPDLEPMLASIEASLEMAESAEPSLLPEPWNRDVRGTQVLPLINRDCSVMRVPAGPGTGKTFGLCRRVLRILHPAGLGISSDRVLVCTFNRVIAKDLRHEIEKTLKPYGLTPPAVMTVHALAAQLAMETPRFLLQEEIEAAIYDVRHENPTIDKMYEFKQDRAMRALREHEAGFAQHTALATVVRSWLTEHRATLVGELPRDVESRMRGGDFTEKTYDHIIIDEFQDLTQIEARMLFKLCSPNGQVVTLGDKKQSIYAFRGNERAGLEGVPELTSGPIDDVTMNECQRCPQEIVQLANEVMAIYGEPLIYVKGPGGQIHQIHHPTPASEHRRLAKEIVRVYRERPDQKHLVLVTRRQWGYDLRKAIKDVDADLNVQTVFSEDILESWPVREAFLFLSIVGIPTDTAAVRDWLSYKQPDQNGKNWKAPKRNAEAYLNLKTKYGLPDLQRLLELENFKDSDLSGSGRKNVVQRVQRLQALCRDLPATENTTQILEYIFNPDLWIIGGGVVQSLAREDLARLAAEAKRMVDTSNTPLSLREIVEKLRYLISTREPLGADEEPAIKIVTLWGAKGLTADFVYIVGLCDEALPGPFREDNIGLTASEHEREQLRLLYVSLTRAKQAVILSRPVKIPTGQVAALGLTTRPHAKVHYQRLKPVRFFTDIGQDYLPDSVSGEQWAGIRLDPSDQS